MCMGMFPLTSLYKTARFPSGSLVILSGFIISLLRFPNVDLISHIRNATITRSSLK
jgi:hypothetical protein